MEQSTESCYNLPIYLEIPPTVVNMKINEKIRFLRERKNWSQEDMADKLQMSTNGYSKIERGESRINVERLEQIANVLDIDIIELISTAERNVVFFQDSDYNLNIIGSSEESKMLINQLKLELHHKNEIIEMQKKELETLKLVLTLLKNN